MPEDKTTPREPTNASLIDARIDGSAAARAEAKRVAPWFFTPAARAEWLRAYDEVANAY